MSTGCLNMANAWPGSCTTRPSHALQRSYDGLQWQQQYQMPVMSWKQLSHMTVLEHERGEELNTMFHQLQQCTSVWRRNFESDLHVNDLIKRHNVSRR